MRLNLNTDGTITNLRLNMTIKENKQPSVIIILNLKNENVGFKDPNLSNWDKFSC